MRKELKFRETNLAIKKKKNIVIEVPPASVFALNFWQPPFLELLKETLLLEQISNSYIV